MKGMEIIPYFACGAPFGVRVVIAVVQTVNDPFYFTDISLKNTGKHKKK